jgi:hypothetical protein
MRTRIAEFDWLKMFALLLLILVHSDLYFAFPEIIYPIQWFLLSCFFFISGFLAFDSFHKCGGNIRNFCKSKILSLYAPFVAASVFYFVLQVVVGATTADPLRLLSHVSLLNIFDGLNSAYNWGSLWFVPYLLVFMLILGFTMKYVKNAKTQVLLVSFIWFCTILAWVYDAPMKLGQVFSQYFLIFMIGVWFNKFKMYDRVMKLKTACVTVPLAALFSLNFSYLFTFNSTTEALTSLLYFNGRSIILSLSAILLALLLLRKLTAPRNRFVELIATTSVLIYLTEPFLSYILRTFIFGQLTLYFAAGAEFYLYQIARIAFLLGLLPLTVKAVKNYRPKIAFAGIQVQK